MADDIEEAARSKYGAVATNGLSTENAGVRAVAEAFGYTPEELASIPAVFVYGRDGKLVRRFDNEEAKTDDDNFTYADVTKLVEELLKAK